MSTPYPIHGAVTGDPLAPPERAARTAYTRPLSPVEAARALCAQSDPEAWFPETGTNPRRAVAICHQCPIQARCLQIALAGPAWLDGIWGGTTVGQRRALRAARRRAVTTTEPTPGTRPAVA